MPVFKVILYESDKGDSPIREYMKCLSESQENKVMAHINKLAEFGFKLKRPAADSLGGGLGLYELRPGRHRILYFFHARTTVVLLNAFLKQSDKIPLKEIKIALKRKVDYLERVAML